MRTAAEAARLSWSRNWLIYMTLWRRQFSVLVWEQAGWKSVTYKAAEAETECRTALRTEAYIGLLSLFLSKSISFSLIDLVAIRKYLLHGYILGVPMQTTGWDQHYGDDETLK